MYTKSKAAFFITSKYSFSLYFLDKMQYKTDQRIGIFGQTGSGKTHLMKQMFLPHLTRFILHDPKFEHKGLKAVYCHKPQDILRTWARNKNKIVYQPYDSEISDFEQVCHYVFQKGNYVLILDEVTYVVKNAQTASKWFGNIIRLGRGRNIGCISLSQRPMDIPNIIISESQHIFAFYLALEGDRKKVAGVVGDEALKLKDTPLFHYLYYTPLSRGNWHKPI